MGWNVDVEFRPSTIHGTGAFAKQKIKAGTKVWSFDKSMQVCDLPKLAALTPERLAFALHGGYLHHPSGKFIWYDDGMQFVNHAFGNDSNIGITEWTPLEEDNCTALRDIEAGEELLEDYSFWSITQLPREHWLCKLYADFCPHHYDFLMSLSRVRVAA
jgi:SET domain-containing protein